MRIEICRTDAMKIVRYLEEFSVLLRSEADRRTAMDEVKGVTVLQDRARLSRNIALKIKRKVRE